MELKDREERASRLEKDILHLARNTILVHLRFMDIAVSRLRQERLDCGAMATDGDRLCYDRKALFDSYRTGREKVARDFLHLLLHCIFRHMYIHAKINETAWDLATDIAVENCINELADSAFTCGRQFGQAEIIEELREELGTLTAEKIYRYLVNQEIPESELYEMRKLFSGDSHILWYSDSNDDGDEEGKSDSGSRSEGRGDSSQQEEAERSSDSEKTGKTNDDDKSNKDNNNTSNDKGDEKSSGGDNNQGSDNESTNEEENESDPESIKSEDRDDSASEKHESGERQDSENERTESPSEKAWHDLSDRIRQDLENFSREQGSRAGSLIQNIRSVNRERYDYGAFLRRFASRCEIMRINDEEFDYMYYMHGLKTYGNMPLVEPLEYKDARVIRELAIVIDTSGSVQGELVQKFIQKTYNILHQEESFRKQFVLHIIQCDAEIQEDVVIRNRREMETYLGSMQIHGLGGTDFRPAFQYVDDLVRKSELKYLRGMVYFTDGHGAFPASRPPYETAFIFLDDNDNNIEVPAWAIRLVLRPDDIC